VLLGVVAFGLWSFRAPLATRFRALRGASPSSAAPIEVAVIQRGILGVAPPVGSTAANGYIVARRRAALSADTPGRIVELAVTEGSVVRKGELVARLYSDELEASLRGAEAEVVAGEAAVITAEARVRAARQRLDEAAARVATAASQRDEVASMFALAERERDRAKSLVDTGGVPRERVEQASAGVEQMRARLASSTAGVSAAEVGVAASEADVAVAVADAAGVAARLPVLAAARDLARASLEKTIVRAPFDGVVVLKDAEVGEVVSPNALGGQSRGSVATMVDFESLEVQVELPETSLGSVAVDREVTVYLDAFASEPFHGRVLRIWPTANRQKGTIELRIGLDDIDPRMRPEMGARVVFLGPEATPRSATAGSDAEPQLLVPSTAIVRRGDREGVFILEGDLVRFCAVTPGAVSGRRRALLEPEGVGVKEGDRVIVAPPDTLRDGDRVSIGG